MSNTGKTASRKPKSQGKTTGTFQSRVDYVAKALRRGSWGDAFNACFEQHDSPHLVAVLMQRAECNPELRDAIITSFGADNWNEVPWHEVEKPFQGVSTRRISAMADEARRQANAEFAALYRDPGLMLSQV